MIWKQFYFRQETLSVTLLVISCNELSLPGFLGFDEIDVWLCICFIKYHLSWFGVQQSHSQPRCALPEYLLCWAHVVTKDQPAAVVQSLFSHTGEDERHGLLGEDGRLKQVLLKHYRNMGNWAKVRAKETQATPLRKGRVSKWEKPTELSCLGFDEECQGLDQGRDGCYGIASLAGLT